MNVKQIIGSKVPMKYREYFRSKYPTSLQIEVTTKCNLNCTICPRRNFEDFEQKHIDVNLFKKVIDDAGPHLKSVFLWGVGEPLLHPSFFSMVEYVKSKNIKVIFTTNGTLLTKFKCHQIINHDIDEVIISMDAVMYDTFKDIRGIDICIVEDGIKNLNSAKNGSKKPNISLNYVLLEKNIKEANYFMYKAAKLDLFTIKYQNVLAFNNFTENQSLIMKEEIYKTIFHNLKMKKHVLPNHITLPETKLTDYPQCKQPWFGAPNIIVNGDVTPCTFIAYPLDIYHIRRNSSIVNEKTKFNPMILGNVKKESIVDIWNNEQYVSLCKSFMSNEPLHPCDICLNQDGIVC